MNYLCNKRSLRTTTAISLVMIGAVILLSAKPTNKNIGIVNDIDAASKAYIYLNQFRLNPSEYGYYLGLNLRGVPTGHVLQWNETLAEVAREKAIDMAVNDYFSHVNSKGLGMNVLMHRAGYKLPKTYLRPKTLNYFESIAAGATTGEELINLLIIDKGVPSLAHRKHLLGIDNGIPYNSLCLDIGIGFTRALNEDNEFISYACVLIAYEPSSID